MTIVCAGFPEFVLARSQDEPSGLSEHLTPLLSHLMNRESVLEAMALPLASGAEFYLHTVEPEDAVRAVCEAVGSRADEKTEERYVLSGRSAIDRLFKLAANRPCDPTAELRDLDDLRVARDIALRAGSATGILNFLTSRALHAGREARVPSIAVRPHPRQIQAALNVIGGTFGSAHGRSALVLGHGGLGEELCTRLAAESTALAIVEGPLSRSAPQTAWRKNASVLQRAQIPSALARRDIIIICEETSQEILPQEEIEEAVKHKFPTPVLLLDFSDQAVASGCSELENLLYLSRADFPSGEEELSPPEHGAASAEETIEETIEATIEAAIEAEAERFSHLTVSPEIQAVISQLRLRTEKTLEKHMQRFGKRFSEDERVHLEVVVGDLLSTVLQEITSHLLELDLATDEGLHEFQIACRLFNVSLGPDR